MDRFIEQPLPPALGGRAIARILCDVWNHTGMKDHLPIVLGIKSSIKIEIRAFQYQARHFGHALQRFQTLWKQHHIRLIHGSNGEGSHHRAMVVRDGDDFLALLVFVPRIPKTVVSL